KVATVVVADKQLSLAIGKEGQNARLAAKLTGWRIDIKSEVQVNEELMRKQMEQEALLAAQQIVTEAEEGIAAEGEAEAELPLQGTPEMAAPIAPPVELAPTEIEPAIAAVESLAEGEAEPEEELSFAEALEQFEQRQAKAASDEDEEGDDERTRKLK